MDESNSYILTISCPDTVGIVAEVAGYLRDRQFFIEESSHYGDLDEGPIIEQTVERVDHTHSTEDMVAIGRDVEAITLARAVRFHTEHRVFLNGKRTVVFRR